MQIRPYEDRDEAAFITRWRDRGLTRPWNNPKENINRKLALQPERFNALNNPTPDSSNLLAACPSFDQLHYFLVREMGLLAEPEHSGSWRTYFFNEIVWHPASTTRTVKVLLDHTRKPFKIQLCVSSDNNNSVFVAAPFDAHLLKRAIENEISQLSRR